MNKTIKSIWIAALRSDKYEQGQQRLRSLDNKFCCLGVLGDCLNADWQKSFDCYTINCFTHKPPVEMQDRAGLFNSDVEHLIDMNDGGKTFDEIADWIEKNL